VKQRRWCAGGQRGISLVEALVALAVLSFGMLALVGVQSTLRLNADVAKQRAEAVRIAQEEIERWRSFANLQGAGGTVSFGNLQDGTEGARVGTNASYTLSRSIDPDTDTLPPYPPFKTLVVDVSWIDRSNVSQTVRLSTAIAAVPPELAGTLSVRANGVPTQQPGGRNPSIPLAAKDLGDGTSGLRPPQDPGDGVVWVFDNTTGLITTCSTTAASTSALALGNINACTDGRSQLLSGFVRFALPNDPGPPPTSAPIQPVAADAELPSSTAQLVGVQVLQTAPSEGTVECFEELSPLSVSYFCAVPVASGTDPPTWSGRSLVGGLSLATSLTDATESRYRVCRYTPVRDCHPAVASFVWGAPGTTLACTGSDPTPKRRFLNVDHPLDYANASAPLSNQNFLVIRAGDGTTPFTCPGDDTGTLSVNGNTWHHQPDT
jgi:type II secretory pathway pseudopilin PulG